jgi:hypothetical protein
MQDFGTVIVGMMWRKNMTEIINHINIMDKLFIDVNRTIA